VVDEAGNVLDLSLPQEPEAAQDTDDNDEQERSEA
jgi:hypothetical protein